MEQSNDLVTVEYLLRAEGGYAHSPHDSGGETIYGIASKWNPVAWRNGPPTLDEARQIWLGNGPDGNGYLREWQLTRFPQAVANKLTDLLCPRNVLPEAVMVLQRALWAASGRKLLIDGVAGPVTMQRVADQCQYKSTELILLVALRSEIAAEYRMLVAHAPRQEPNLAGWLNRSYM